ncbi:hypothetical protein DRO02_06005 [archaeon]|nr:MAG: hypothetical protein DRO02_06005 [archaeon]
MIDALRKELLKVLSEVDHVPSTYPISNLLREFARTNPQIIEVIGDKIVFMDRIGIAKALYGMGASIREILRALNWRDLEDYVRLVLEVNGFRSVRGIKFRTVKGFREIDVVGFRDNMILCVECKHFKKIDRNMLASTARRLATKSFEYLSMQRSRGFKKAVPLIVTSAPLKYDHAPYGIPVLNASSLPMFVANLEKFLNKILVLEAIG